MTIPTEIILSCCSIASEVKLPVLRIFFSRISINSTLRRRIFKRILVGKHWRICTMQICYEYLLVGRCSSVASVVVYQRSLKCSIRDRFGNRACRGCTESSIIFFHNEKGDSNCLLSLCLNFCGVCTLCMFSYF